MMNQKFFKGQYIEISAPLELSDIEVLATYPPTTKWVQFYNYKPNDNDLNILNQFFTKNKSLYMRWANNDIINKMSELERFWFNKFDEPDFEIFTQIKKISGLNLGKFAKKLDILPLLKYSETLNELSFEGDVKKGGEEIISELSNLNYVSFISSAFSSFKFLTGLNLETFRFYGSRTKNYEDLANITSLKHFLLKTNTNWIDFSFIEKLINLETIELLYVAGIEKFPKVEHLKNLKSIRVIENNKLKDISEIKKLKNCETVVTGAFIPNKHI